MNSEEQIVVGGYSSLMSGGRFRSLEDAVQLDPEQIRLLENVGTPHYRIVFQHIVGIPSIEVVALVDEFSVLDVKFHS